jgi:hypothetical protein
LRLAYAVSRDRVAAPRRITLSPVNNRRQRIVPAGANLELYRHELTRGAVSVTSFDVGWS